MELGMLAGEPSRDVRRSSDAGRGTAQATHGVSSGLIDRRNRLTNRPEDQLMAAGIECTRRSKGCCAKVPDEACGLKRSRTA